VSTSLSKEKQDYLSDGFHAHPGSMRLQEKNRVLMGWKNPSSSMVDKKNQEARGRSRVRARKKGNHWGAKAALFDGKKHSGRTNQGLRTPNGKGRRGQMKSEEGSFKSWQSGEWVRWGNVQA